LGLESVNIRRNATILRESTLTGGNVEMNKRSLRGLLTDVLLIRFVGSFLLTLLNLPIAILLIPISFVYWAVIIACWHYLSKVRFDLNWIVAMVAVFALSCGVAWWLFCGIHGNRSSDGSPQAWEMRLPTEQDIILILYYSFADTVLTAVALAKTIERNEKRKTS
jgi:cation transport ATPase